MDTNIQIQKRRIRLFKSSCANMIRIGCAEQSSLKGKVPTLENERMNVGNFLEKV